MKMIKLFLTILFLVSAIAGYSQEKMRIAIMDFEAKDISVSDAGKISELIRNELINADRFIIIERAQMNQILKEQGVQQSGCTDVSCAVEMGKVLSARKILVGSVMKLGGKIIITGRIVDVEKGVAEFSEKAVANDEGDLHSTVSNYVSKLVGSIDKKGVAGKGGGDKKQGAGNPYGVPAFGFTGLSLLSFGGGYYFNMQVGSLKSDYDSMAVKYKAATASAEAEKLHKDMKSNRDDAAKFALYRNISYGVGGASFLAAGYFFYQYFAFSPARSARGLNIFDPGIIPFVYMSPMISQGNNYFNRPCIVTGITIQF